VVEVELEGAPLPVRRHPLPEEWGVPPADVDQRRAWAIRNIRAGEVRAHRGERVDWLAPALRRPLSGREALRRLDVQTRNENRLRLLQILERAAPSV
jgi:hypothetical protein